LETDGVPFDSLELHLRGFGTWGEDFRKGCLFSRYISVYRDDLLAD